MADRSYINGHEWLGNNEYIPEIWDELARQGCKFDAEGFTVEPFQVKDLDGLVRATEKAIIRFAKENEKWLEDHKPMIKDYPSFMIHKFGDYSHLFDKEHMKEYESNEESLTNQMAIDVFWSRMFYVYNLLFFIGIDNYQEDFKEHRLVYNLKPNAKCVFEFN